MSSAGVSESIIFFKGNYFLFLWNSLGSFATVFLAWHHIIVKIVHYHKASVLQFLLVLIVKFYSLASVTLFLIFS